MRPPRFAKDQPSPPTPVPDGREEDERVGNCRPPRASRFRPGQSGNPRGRPNRARILGTLVARAFDETVEATENGQLRRITKLEAALTQLVNRAATGDLRATQIALSLLPNDQERPAPRKAKRIGKGDSLVVAELIRRLSRPSAPAGSSSPEQPPDQVDEIDASSQAAGSAPCK
jgi:Family of unknown function (DUF5681)